MSVRVVAVPLAALGLMAVGGAGHAGLGAGAGGPAPDHLAWPLTGWVETQAYGCTSFELEPVAAWCPGGHFHSGIDMAAPAGTPVQAAAAGEARVELDPTGYGIYVVVQHGGGFATLYAHLESASLRTGDAVGAGDEVGRVGSTGLSTGPHLHFEVRRDGRPVDPVPWLPAGRWGG
jgi:murein DD-endopeptidase MepM/ murein hydrolase activator NlpD